MTGMVLSCSFLSIFEIVIRLGINILLTRQLIYDKCEFIFMRMVIYLLNVSDQ